MKQYVQTTLWERNEKCTQSFGWKPEGKRRLGRPGRGWEDNIRMDVTETREKYVNWMNMAQDRDRWLALLDTVINI
jgi:hypothetical protein